MKGISDNNGIHIHNHLVRKQAPIQFSQTVRLQTTWLWVGIPLLKLKLQMSPLFRARISSTFRQPDCRFTLKLVK